MLSRSGILLLGGLVFLAGCQTTKRAAISSFRVIDAPAQYVRNHIDPDATRTTTTTTTQTTDVVNPGYPVYAPAPTPPPVAPPRVAVQTRPTTSVPRVTSTGTRSPQRTSTPTASTTSSTPRPSASEPRQFPTARAVPGKPGYVYSIDPSGGIVDVTGYKSGDKAKDPYTQQIFVVP